MMALYEWVVVLLLLCVCKKKCKEKTIKAYKCKCWCRKMDKTSKSFFCTKRDVSVVEERW